MILAMTIRSRSLVIFLAATALALLIPLVLMSQSAADPWPAASVLEPPALAKLLTGPADKVPAIFAVAFPVLYNSKHLPHAVFAGPGSKPEGIEALKKAAAGMSRDADIVVYCGCCPMMMCPNIRPAYRALKEMGFTHIRILDIPTNMATDWFGKGYPSEDGQPRPSN
jgi:thiosulfate/3-mercaptopyruvate sulfurtransferase